MTDKPDPTPGEFPSELMSRLRDSGFLEKYPHLADKAETYYRRYLTEIRRQISPQIYRYKSSHFVLQYRLRDATRECGLFTANGKRISVWQELFKLCPFFIVVNTGTPGENTMIRPLDNKFIDLLLAGQSDMDLLQSCYGNLDGEQLQPIALDMPSLTGYIYHTEKALRSAHNSEHKERLLRGLREARLFVKIGTAFVEEGILEEPSLLQVQWRSPYGRTYLQGPNLQSCSKEVRRAAIGDHYEYDLNAALYAIKMILATVVASERGESLYGRFTYTKEYLDLKSGIRSNLAKHIQAYPDPLKLVKQAITAIGFGAKLQSDGWNDGGKFHESSLSEIIKNPEDRHRFRSDPWVIQFTKEQNELKKYITDYYKSLPGALEFYSNVPGVVKNGRIVTTQLLTYLFQTLETQIMEGIKVECGAQPLLHVHDSFITRQPIKLLQVREYLHSLSPYLSIDVVQHSGWYANKEEEEYLNHKRKEEELARSAGYTDVCRHAIPPIQRTKRVQEDFQDGVAVYANDQYDPSNPIHRQLMGTDSLIPSDLQRIL